MLTQDEAELYDRQIRLWGVNAQSRLRQSKVLMLGFNGVASEVAKILVLAGIDSLTIVDDKPLQDNDLTSNLFCRPSVQETKNGDIHYRTDHVREKLKILNPLVKVNIENVPISSKRAEDFEAYDLVSLHSFLKIDDIAAINQMCRKCNIKFYVVLDYGYFGFMFNDLGSEFKYTYEEFDVVTDNHHNVTKQSGEIKDPINFDDDEGDSNIDETTDDENRQDSGRPKKRRRHLSPDRKDIPSANEKNEKKHKADCLSYTTFQEAISLEGGSFDKKSSPILFLTVALLKFYSEYNRLPSEERDEETKELSRQDISKLNEIIAKIKDSLNLSDSIFKKLNSNWSTYIHGSLSPVCAIVGGVAGQDMIRSLSNKDVPIYNTFSFDGIDMYGTVEKLTPQTKTTMSVPIVRDYLEID